MTSGYTYKVEKGEISFRDFTLDCSRAFGALVYLRDQPNAPIPDEILPSPYHEQELKNARRELRRAENMSLEEAEREVNQQYKSDILEFNKGKKTNAQTRINYESMLEQVRNWQPPTKDHVGLRDFMISQLEESIESDCGGSYYDEPPKKQTGEEYRTSLIEYAQESIARHKDRFNKEVQDAKQGNEWLRALKDNLPK